jgi:hypothetical protein
MRLEAHNDYDTQGLANSKATVYEQKKAEAAIPHRVRGLREPSFRRPIGGYR